MPSTRTLRALALAGASLSFAPGPSALADEKPPPAALPSPDSRVRVLAPSRSRPDRTPGDSASGWWQGPTWIVAAFAVVGGFSYASKRFLPARESGPFQVLGRSALSSKQSVYLLRVGDRVLILGAGPQGPPSTLGEVTDPAELARLIPRPAPRPAPGPTAPAVASRFDRRIGDDE